MTKLVTIATFEYPQHAYIIKSKLESEGIYVYLKDELTIQSDNFLSNAIGGVKLQVNKKEVLRAKELLKLFDFSVYRNTENMQEIKVSNSKDIVCPNCKSDNIRKSRKIRGAVGWLLFLFMIPVPLYYNDFHCFDCYIDFKVSKE